MKNSIPLTGLVASSSDHDAHDGELGAVLNLINEDEALRPLFPPDKSQGFNIGGPACTIVYVHAAANQRRYIIYCSDVNRYFWNSGDGVNNLIALSDAPYNEVTAIGNILCFIGDSGTVYAVWNGTNYSIVSGFGYTAEISTFSTSTDLTQVYMGDDYPETTDTLTKAQARNIFLALDAALNKTMEGSISPADYFKYANVGFVALKMYDGTYVMLSDVFILGPESDNPQEDLRLYPGEKMVRTLGWKQVCTHGIRIKMPQAQALKELIASAVVFLAPPVFLRNVDKAYHLTLENNAYHFAYDHLSDDELTKMLEDLAFYKSIEIPVRSFNSNSYISLKRVSETNESLSLADMRRSQVAAKCGYSYNNRLHVANVARVWDKAFSATVRQTFDSYAGDDQHLFYAFIGQDIGYSEQQKAEAKAIIRFSDNSMTIATGELSWPLPPVLLFPSATASYIDRLCLKIDNGVVVSYEMYTQIPLTASTNWGCAYNLNIAGGLPRFNVNGHLQPEPATASDFNSFEENARQDYGDSLNTSFNTSQLLVSEVENPFVFPARNAVSVGNGNIIAMAANTKAISQGQFGDYPLYVFTDEATWALNVNTLGTYSSRQPVSRDVISSKNSLVSIDNAVVFTTARGIMVLQGHQTTCISDVLDGTPFLFPQMPLAQTVLDAMPPYTIPYQAISYVRFRKLFMKGARMIFDYARQRLIVFNASYAYAYVYSFRSHHWGAMENCFSEGVNNISMAIMDDDVNERRIAVPLDSQDNSRIATFACTRPLSLGVQHVHKTISTAIVRGMFRREQMGCILYGSNDLYQWYPVNSAASSRLLAHIGTPYKYFRLAFVASLSRDNSVHAIDIDFIPRLNNHLR